MVRKLKKSLFMHELSCTLIHFLTYDIFTLLNGIMARLAYQTKLDKCAFWITFTRLSPHLLTPILTIHFIWSFNFELIDIYLYIHTHTEVFTRLQIALSLSLSMIYIYGCRKLVTWLLSNNIYMIFQLLINLLHAIAIFDEMKFVIVLIFKPKLQG